jgi:hypothetical protein
MPSFSLFKLLNSKIVPFGVVTAFKTVKLTGFSSFRHSYFIISAKRDAFSELALHSSLLMVFSMKSGFE